MNNPIESEDKTVIELKNWETPTLNVSNVETITESGGLISDDQEDAFYTS